MDLKFRVPGKNHKELAAAIAKILNCQEQYLDALNLIHKVDEYFIDKDGVVTGPDNQNLLDALTDIGFMPEIELSGDSTLEAPGQLTIEIPRCIFTDNDSIIRLRQMVSSYAALIKKALGIVDLSIELTDTTIKFPWFSTELKHEYLNVYIRFIGALCNAANRQFVNQKIIIDDEIFVFRIFLVNLGFVGEKYKILREMLLRNLRSNSKKF